MDGWCQIHGWLASRPARFFKQKGPQSWTANHVLGFPHPFWGYIIGICILLNKLSLSWVVFSLSVDAACCIAPMGKGEYVLSHT